MLKWGASQALWSQRNIFTINFFFSVQQMPSNEHLFYPSEKEHVYSWISCHIDRKSHLVWTLKRVICTHHCRTEALLCCWDSLMLLFQLQLSLSFISGFWRGSSRIAGLWEGPSTRTVRFYCEGLQLSFPSVLLDRGERKCESKLWLNQLILSFEKRALQLAFLPQTGEDLHLLWTK